MADKTEKTEKTLPPPPWRETSLYRHLKEVNAAGYQAMLEYEKAGGVLDVREKSAKKYYELNMARHKKKNNKSLNERIEEDATKDITGDIEVDDSWDE